MSAVAPEAVARLRTWLGRLALAAAALTFVVIVSSAFLRHAQAGLGCADWPRCYGRVAAAEVETPQPAPVRGARAAHRIAATGVLALVIGMLLIAWTQRPAWTHEGMLAGAALVVATALAVLGIATPGARLPAITLGNLGGGFLMLALFAAIGGAAADKARGELRWATRASPLAWVAPAVLAIAFVQALLGAMIGAQYAVTACPGITRCPGFVFDAFGWSDAFDPLRPVSVVEERIVPPSGAAGIHVMHRALGFAVAIAALTVAHALRDVDRRAARAIAALAVAAPLLGIAAIVAMPSLPLTIAHNAAAAALIASLAYAVDRCRRRRAMT